MFYDKRLEMGRELYCSQILNVFSGLLYQLSFNKVNKTDGLTDTSRDLTAETFSSTVTSKERSKQQNSFCYVEKKYLNL